MRVLEQENSSDPRSNTWGLPEYIIRPSGLFKNSMVYMNQGVSTRT